jgi:transposase
MGLQKNSLLLKHDSIHIRFDIQVNKKKSGRTEGSDQGMRTCITLSDGQVTGKCPHGHSLESICKKLSKKKKGSKSFKKSQEHRKNYINWAIKHLDLTDIKEINLEKIRYLGKGQRKSRYLQSFTYKEIKTALTKTCNLNGVHIRETSNAYRSQRCSSCGFVHKSSRHGEMFKCRNCGYAANADLNAAMNHKITLVEIPARFNHLPNKTTGFYWNKDGLFDVNGVEITVPLVGK